MKQRTEIKFLTALVVTAVSSFAIAQTVYSIREKPTAKFTQGIIYSRMSFPGHPLNDSLIKLDYETGDLLAQRRMIDALKQHQRSIKGQNEQEIKDAFFVSGIMVLPAYSKMYFTSSKALIKTDALGYHQQLLIDHINKSGKLVLADRDNINQGTVNFQIPDINAVWQKYGVDTAQYTIQETTETAVIAGYNCKKIIYTFGSTSRGTGVSNYIINLQPQKITAWYSDDLPASINLMHTHDFELQKAVLKYEVEFDKNKKNKMLVEITGIKTQKIDDEKFDLTEKAPVVQHTKNGFESGSVIMPVTMYAISLLTK